ncbi:MAG: GTP-binding protein [Candidatus Lokiarchaeota archaeon]|nr:GTP-binding protein [Candidatus Lokiarchaeota archaeon]
MSLIKKQYFNELFTKFLLKYDDVDALIASDREGFIIGGQKRASVDMELVSVLTTLINPVLERIQEEFAFKKFGSASFDTEENRILFISIDDDTTLSVVLNTLASIDKISPYVYFLAEKTAQIMNAGEEDIIQVDIPIFGTEIDDTSETGRLKDQIYQMRLNSGGSYKFKFIIVGDKAVGKTSIVRRFVDNKFSLDYRSTLGLNVLSHTMDFYGNEVNFLLWDLGGQEYFKRFRKTYYIGAQAAFIVFDVGERNSFSNIKKWYNELKEHIGKNNIPIVIVGNKIDLSDSRTIQYKEGIMLVDEFSQQNATNDFSYIETSALTGENVEDAFSLIAYHYIMLSNEREEKKLRKNLMNQLNSILNKTKKLEITFITENPFWSPGLQILNEVNNMCECDKILDDKEKRLYKYSNGLLIKNLLFDNIEVADSDGVFIIFDARNKNHIDPKWKEVVINIIQELKENKLILIGIRVSEELDWSDILEEFNVNEYLEKKVVSLLFFKIGLEYRLEIYDELEVMFSTILNSINN